MDRCRKRYGKRRRRVCARPAGHLGHHAIRLKVGDLRRLYGGKP
jgi:hypothetical protein